MICRRTRSRARETASNERTGIFCATRFIFFTKTTAWPRRQNGIDYLGKKFPDKPILDNDTNSFPRNLTLDEYAVGRVQEDLGDTSQERMTADVQGLLARAYFELAIGQDDRYAGSSCWPPKVYEHYQTKISGMKSNLRASVCRRSTELNRTVLNQLLDPQKGLPLRRARRDAHPTRYAGGNERAAATAISTNAPLRLRRATNAPPRTPSNQFATGK